MLPVPLLDEDVFGFVLPFLNIVDIIHRRQACLDPGAMRCIELERIRDEEQRIAVSVLEPRRNRRAFVAAGDDIAPPVDQETSGKRVLQALRRNLALAGAQLRANRADDLDGSTASVGRRERPYIPPIREVPR